MRAWRVLALLASVLVIAGCGSSQKAHGTGLREALRQSRSSYLHYTSPAWWGRRVRVTLHVTPLDGTYAIAHVDVAAGPPVSRTQWSLLERTSTGWDVLSTTARKSYMFDCEVPAVVRQRSGRCTSSPHDFVGVISGRRAERAATRSEFAAISAAAESDARGIGCAGRAAAISTVDSRYARVAPKRKCWLEYRDYVFVHVGSGWRYGGVDGGVQPCGWYPPGAIRSLFGRCWLLPRG